MKNITPKVGATIALLDLLGLSVVGCSSPEPSSSTANESSNSEEAEQTQEEEPAPAPEPEPEPEPVSLEGEWRQNHSNGPENTWQSVTITGNTIEVYWAGIVEVPAEGESFSFVSANDTTKTANAMLASSDLTKTFTFENDELSYEVTAMGTTMTVRPSRE